MKQKMRLSFTVIFAIIEKTKKESGNEYRV
jgi:Mor family transcriptional regulator